jgi:hypothetical protein
MTEDDIVCYSDDEISKEKKIVNKISDYSLRKRKLMGERLKVKKSKIKHKVLIPGVKKMNREKLVKSELEYSDYSESEEESSSIEEEEDRSLIKRRNTEDDDDGDGEQIRLHNSSKISKILIPSKDSSYGNLSNNSNENNNNDNNKNTLISNILSLKTLIISVIIGFTGSLFFYRWK